MKIQVKIIKELPDGSAECELTMDKAGHKFLMQAGFTAVMETVINERKRENDIRELLVAIPKKGRKANSKKIVGKAKSGKPTKGTRGNSRASKILGSKGN
jgi:hypothetical protein